MGVKKFLKRYFKGLFFLRYSFAIIKYPAIIKEFITFKNEALKKGYKVKFEDLFLITNEKTSTTHFDAHYTYHPAWAARAVKEINPQKHVDISSILSFAAQLSTFIPTEFYDYRPAHLNLSNLTSGQADLCDLPFKNNSIESLSCMHTIEHVGLGRYGDPIDFNGDKKAINELQRVLAYEGNLLFVTPVGKPIIQFNAHRIYSFEQIIEKFDQLELVEFSLIPDDGMVTGIINKANPELVKNQTYACGCFWFKKPYALVQTALD